VSITVETARAMLGPPARWLGWQARATPAERERAFATLYESQFDRIFGYLRYRVDDPSVAEELAAETFSRAWAKLADPTPSDRAIAWLVATARNLVADHFRSRRASVPLQALTDQQHPRGGLIEPGVVAAEQLAEVRACLAALSEREQDVVGLRFVAGLRNREIAVVIGTTEGNVAKILHRSLRAVRARLGERDGEQQTGGSE
jgi:RNA polymerase sigma factor (sigma-70 family)